MKEYHDMILGLPGQFSFRPHLEHGEKLPHSFQRVIVSGMGGSRLAPDILNICRPDLELYVHSTYDLPEFSPDHLKHSLVIAHSFSGNTAETISTAKEAISRGLNLVVITTGGMLLDIAREHKVPHIIIPSDGLVPRLALGYELMALAHLLKLDMTDFVSASKADIKSAQTQGDKIAENIGDKIPLIYVPDRYNELGYVWKIIFNETAKIPAFSNRFPELDHNEFESLIDGPHTSNFYCVMLNDDADQRISKRMDHTASMMTDHGISVTRVKLQGDTILEKIIQSLVMAHWAAAIIAQKRGVDPARVPAIEVFKQDLHEQP